MQKKVATILFSVISFLAFGQQPLVPREAYFKEPEIGEAKISRDGQKVAFTHLDPDGTPHLFWLNLDRPQEQHPLPLPGKIKAYEWAPDGSLIAVSAVLDSALIYRITEDSIRDITPFPLRGATISALSRKYPERFVMELKAVNSYFNGYYFFFHNGDKPQQFMNLDGFSKSCFDEEFNLRAGLKPNAKNSVSLWFRNANGDWVETEKYAWNPGRFMGGLEGIVSLSTDGSALYYVDNVGQDICSVKKLSLATGEKTSIYADGRADMLYNGASINPTTGVPMAVVCLYGVAQRRILDESIKADFENATQLLGEVGWSGCSDDLQRWLLRTMDGGPKRYYVFDRQAQQPLIHLFDEIPSFDKVPKASRSLLEVSASDGLPLACTLYLPAGSDQNRDGVPDHPLPTILYVHGGPWVGLLSNLWFINRNFQLLTNRGYAVIFAEFRSGVGFGKKYLDAGNKEWGAKMNQDLVDIANAAVKKGISKKDKMAIWGWSYGGYAAFAALAFSPSVFACGISMYGVSDLEYCCRQFEDPLWHSRVGDFRDAQGDLRMLRNRSPLTHFKKIKKPLYITQGAKDVIVHRYHSDEMAERLDNAGQAPIYTVYPEEGHDYHEASAWLSFWAIGEQFLAQHLGGQFLPKGEDLEHAEMEIVFGKGKVEVMK